MGRGPHATVSDWNSFDYDGRLAASKCSERFGRRSRYLYGEPVGPLLSLGGQRSSIDVGLVQDPKGFIHFVLVLRQTLAFWQCLLNEDVCFSVRSIYGFGKFVSVARNSAQLIPSPSCANLLNLGPLVIHMCHNHNPIQAIRVCAQMLFCNAGILVRYCP